MKMLLIVFTLLLASSAQADWPMHQGNTKHNGQAPYQGPHSNQLDWSMTIPAGIDDWSSPVIGSYKGSMHVAVGANDGMHLFTLDGMPVFHFPTPYPIESVPAFGDQTILFAAEDTLYAVRADTLRWKLKMDISAIDDSRIQVTPIGGGIYVNDEDHFNAITYDGVGAGSIAVEGDFINSGPAVDSAGNIYFVSSGDPVWPFDNFDFQVYAKAFNGAPLWDYEFTAFEFGGSWMHPTIDDAGTVYLGTRWSSSGFWSSAMHSYDSGGSNWYVDQDCTFSSPALKASTLYYGTAAGFQTIGTNGVLGWSYNVAGPVTYSSPIIDVNDIVYFGTDSGQLVAISTSGQLQWTLSLGPGLTSPAMAADGRIYICDYQTLYCTVPGPNATSTPIIASAATELRIWPNPARTSFNLSVGSQSVGQASINIYDVQGRLVRRLVDNEFVRGNASWQFRSSLPSGVYFVRLDAGNSSQTKRLVVAR